MLRSFRLMSTRHSLFFEMVLLLIVGLLLWLWLAFAAPAHATVFTPTCPSGIGDVAELRAAIINANNETLHAGLDTITLAAGCVYTIVDIDNTAGGRGNNALPAITSQITINGNGAIITRSTAPVTPQFRLLYIGNGGNLILNTTTISNGIAVTGGGLYNDFGTVMLLDSTITGNQSRISGGGGITNRGGTMNIVNSTVTRNQSSVSVEGGAIMNMGSVLTITNSLITDNLAFDPSDRSLADIYGGAIYSDLGDLNHMTITDSVISGNQVTGFLAHGGGIGMLGGTLSITRSTFINNVANNTLNPGRATGGAIATYETTVTITDSTIAHNSTTGLTGGGWAGAASGGGIDLRIALGDTVVISNTTVSGNEAIGGTGTFQNGPGGGGAMMVSGQGTLLLQNTTIFGNYTNGGTGLYAGSAGLFISAPASAPTVQLANTVIAGNILPIGPDVKGDFTSLGYNVIGDGTGGIYLPAPGDQVGTAVAPLNPQLGPLQANGGPTWSHLPLANSPLINAGNPALSGFGACAPTDQRGVARPQTGRCEIGAVEVRPLEILTHPADTTINIGETTTLSITISGEALGYQWYQGSSGDTSHPIDGANESSLTTPVLSVTTNYWVYVTAAAGNASSNTAIVTVVHSTNTPTATPSNTPTATSTPTATPSSTPTLTATATPSNTPTATPTPTATLAPSSTPTATVVPCFAGTPCAPALIFHSFIPQVMR